VAPGIYGPNHQHFFNVRMDMAVDGPNNSVYEVDSIVEQEELNPYRNAWYNPVHAGQVGERGCTRLELGHQPYWKIASDKTNELGEKTAYKLEPRGVVKPFVQPGSFIFDRARFVQKPVWVTSTTRRRSTGRGRLHGPVTGRAGPAGVPGG